MAAALIFVHVGELVRDRYIDPHKTKGAVEAALNGIRLATKSQRVILRFSAESSRALTVT
jgi:hypothetical protein